MNCQIIKISLLLVFAFNVYSSIPEFSVTFDRYKIPLLKEKNIYGRDDRVLVENFQNHTFVELAKSIAAMVSNVSIKNTLDSSIKKILPTASVQEINLCAGEKFSDLPTVTECSGFLVEEDVILTAGHCIKSENNCKKNVRWVFDYKRDVLGPDNSIYTNKKNIYSCKKIIGIQNKKRYKYYEDANDYALIKLDRKVVGRKPLKYRKSFGDIDQRVELLLIGHPMGYPMMIADNAYVRDNNYEYFFVTNLDSFRGNSGSPVFNKETKLVEGLLSRGDFDHIYDFERSCFMVRKCSDDGCRGDLVTRINKIPELNDSVFPSIYLSKLD